uniref:(California timema) hypothetical protein n=1 Tax=Timema californicum TaxID=61474 RepID=A0A7R9J1K0_TIMCA|nr:unnamed protein product [Timema californicum]
MVEFLEAPMAEQTVVLDGREHQLVAVLFGNSHLENELPIIQNSAIQDCNTKVETINFNNEYNMDNLNLKSDPISEDNKKIYSSFDVDNSLTSVERITPITTRLPNMDDDLEFSSSQLLLLENEFQKANLAKPNPGDTMTTKDRRTPSFVLPPSVQPPSIDWARKAQQNRQRLQNIIQDISKLNLSWSVMVHTRLSYPNVPLLRRDTSLVLAPKAVVPSQSTVLSRNLVVLLVKKTCSTKDVQFLSLALPIGYFSFARHCRLDTLAS